MSTPTLTSAALPSHGRTRRGIGLGLLGAWTLILCVGPDPRPLGAPAWAVAAVRAVAGLDEAAGRLIATLALHATGLAILGALVMVAIEVKRWDARGIAALLVAPVLATATLWINLGYLPIPLQIQVATLSAGAGAVATVALHRSPITAASLLIALGGLFAWGTATGISDELDEAAREVSRHLLSRSYDIPDGDDGFSRLIEHAFRFSAARSDGADPVIANRAVILALAVILGEETIADVAARHIDPSRLAEARALRARMTLHGRKDWSQHFWVSAGLSLLSDRDRSIAVGLSKELMDATAGGSGFSFADLAADEAGNRFTLAATRDAKSARAFQSRILAGVRISDYVPGLRDLPEGITRDEFRQRFGGLGGAETHRLVEEIRRRLAACPGLHW